MSSVLPSSFASGRYGAVEDSPRTGVPLLRRLSVFSAALIFAIAMIGCGDDKDDGSSGTTGSTGSEDVGNYGYPADVPRKNSDGELLPPPVQVGGGTESGKRVKKNTVVIIDSQKDLDKLIRQLNRGQKQEILIASTDFKTRQIIAVFLEPKNDGAQAQIAYVRKGDDSYIVNTVRLRSGSGCPNADVKTHPYSVAEIDKLDGKPELVVEEQDSPPC